MSLAVVCPTRGRPQRCSAMIRSMIDSSDATALIYFDEDDDTKPVPTGAWNGSRVHTLLGPRIGRGAAANALCQTFRNFGAYLLVSDDITFTRSGWDRELLDAMDSLQGMGLVHIANSPESHFVNWPCVSRKWIDTLGWFNPPTLRSYCQDTALQALAEAIDRIRRIEPAIAHDSLPEEGNSYGPDREAFLWFMALQFGPALKKLREAICTSTPPP